MMNEDPIHMGYPNREKQTRWMPRNESEEWRWREKRKRHVVGCEGVCLHEDAHESRNGSTFSLSGGCRGTFWWFLLVWWVFKHCWQGHSGQTGRFVAGWQWQDGAGVSFANTGLHLLDGDGSFSDALICISKEALKGNEIAGWW